MNSNEPPSAPTGAGVPDITSEADRPLGVAPCSALESQQPDPMNSPTDSPGIYDEIKAPAGFVRCFIWWAYTDCPNQRYTRLECGAPRPVFNDTLLSPECLSQITSECDEFWVAAKSVIKAAKGRCNWSPSVDTHTHHVAACGNNFFHARRGDLFFMQGWPEPEREEFVSLASKFNPMFLFEVDGLLEYRVGPKPTKPAIVLPPL